MSSLTERDKYEYGVEQKRQCTGLFARYHSSNGAIFA